MSMRIRMFLILGLAVAFPIYKSIAQDNLAQKVDSFFQALVHPDEPGYAVAILKDGNIMYSKGYGLANLDYQIPINEKSAFHLASVSKQFTGACIALLLMEGKLDLDLPAANFIPALKKYRDTIRIKHLIYNTSGLTDYYRIPRRSGNNWSDFNYFTVDECIATSLRLPSLKFKPGTLWDYSNVNWMLLTKIVESISGKPFSVFAEEHLFKPLGMNSTLIHDDITMVIPNRVQAYNKRSPENVADYRSSGIAIRSSDSENYITHHRNSPHYGGSGVISPMEDLSIWAANYHSKSFGGDAFYELMHQTMNFPHGRNNQGFGIYTNDWKGRVKWSWDGGDSGVSTELAHYPDQGISIICLSNLGAGRSFEKVNSLADLLIELGFL